MFYEQVLYVTYKYLMELDQNGVMHLLHVSWEDENWKWELQLP